MKKLPPTDPAFWTPKMRKQVGGKVSAYHSRIWRVKYDRWLKERRKGEMIGDFWRRVGIESRSEEWRERHSTIMREFWAGRSKAWRKRHRARTELALLLKKLRHNHDMGMKPSDQERLERLRNEAE